MEAFIIYLIKAGAAIAIFYLIYYFILKGDTFFSLRRYFLLSVIVFSLIYPFLAIEALGDLFSFRSLLADPSISVTIDEPGMSSIIQDGNSASFLSFLSFINWKLVIMWILVGGMVFLSTSLARQLLSILLIKLKSEMAEYKGVTFYNLKKEITPFSFFNLIFMNVDVHSERELDQIIIHERTHAREMHSLDVMLSEIMCILCWWNPVAWLLKKEISNNLEYLADKSVLDEGVDCRDYQYHLLQLTYQETAVKIVNNFNVSQLKNRIMMMNKSKSPAKMVAKYLILLPLVFVLVSVNSCTNKTNESQGVEEETVDPTLSKQDSTVVVPSEVKEEVFVVVENQPEFPGGTPALMTFLAENIKYPVKAQDEGLQGRVIANFVVEKDGSITDVQIVRGITPSLDEEAIRVIKTMPKWKPGTQNGDIVRVRYTLPIVYQLQPK